MNKRFYTIRDAEFVALESVLDYVMFHPNFLKWDTEQQLAIKFEDRYNLL